MYGTQAPFSPAKDEPVFENDVKMYGTQALRKQIWKRYRFENDVKMYGTQASTLNIVLMV